MLLLLTTRCRSRVRRSRTVVRRARLWLLRPCFRREPRLTAPSDQRQVLQSPLQLLLSASDVDNVLGRGRPAPSHAALTGGVPDLYFWGGAFINPTPSPLRETNGGDPRLTGFLLLQGTCSLPGGAASLSACLSEAAAAHPPFYWSKLALHGCTMATFVCRVQFLDDTDPFNSTNFPEPTRPPLYTFREDIPLINQIAGVHRLLKAPHRVGNTVYSAFCLCFCVTI